jgi:hypothetical protein
MSEWCGDLMPNTNLPLNDISVAGLTSASSFVADLSSDDYNELMQSGLTTLDILDTYFFRYSKVLANDIPSANGEHVTTQGFAIDYSALHPAFAVVATASFASLAITSVYYEYKRQKKVKLNSSYHYIYHQFHKLPASVNPDKGRIKDIKDYLEVIIKEDPDLKQEYNSISINPCGNSIDFDAKKLPEVKKENLWTKLKNRVIYPIWASLSIASFTYWILWIGIGIVTGNFAVVGIDSLPPVVAFGLPVLSGLIYPFLNIYNYFKYRVKVESPAENLEVKKQDMILRTQASQHICSIFRRAIIRREFDFKKAQLLALYGYSEKDVKADSESDNNVHAPSIDKPITSLGKNKWKKATVALISTVGGTYVAAQYGSWIIMDLINIVANISSVLPLVNFVVGIVLLTVTGLYGIYKGYERYNSVKANNNLLDIKENQKLINLEERLENLKKFVHAKKLELGLPLKSTKHIKRDVEKYFDDIHRRDPNKWTRTKKILKRAFQFVNGFTTGAFIARIFFIKGTVTALPFVAAAFSNPITIGVIVGIGVLYGAFKTYEYHQKRKEERAQLLLAKRAEKITFLKQEIDLAVLEEKLITLKIQDKYKSGINLSSETITPNNTQPKIITSSRGIFTVPNKLVRVRSLSVGDAPLAANPRFLSVKAG